MKVNENNYVMPLAIIYTILWTLGMVVGFIFCLAQKIDWLIFVVDGVLSLPTLIALWSLGKAIDRITILEKRILYLSKSKLNKKSLNDKIEDFVDDAVIDTDGECVTICSKCGYQIFADEDKCSNCGHKK